MVGIGLRREGLPKSTGSDALENEVSLETNEKGEAGYIVL
jgi:hypothetical protein